MSGHGASKSASNSAQLLQREEEYKRLNKELEAQTAMLVKEAEVMMRDQDNFLKQVSPPHTESSGLRKSSSASKNREETSIMDVVSRDTDLLAIAAGAFEDDYSDDDSYGGALNISPSRNDSYSTVVHRPPSNLSNQHIKSGKAVKPSRSLDQTVKAKNPKELLGDDIMPDVAGEMGTEAQIRFLKAKLRVLQEDLTNQTKLCQSAVNEASHYKAELKEAKEDTERIKKNFNQQQTQIQKLKHGFEEEKKKNETRTAQFQAVQKELEALKRDKKQSSTAHSATEVRLNRATEELEKLKIQLQKQKHFDKEITSRDQREIEKIRIENKRLERLRNDSLTVMKKQQKLIGILKRQILHIEAAKLLSFTEDEFVKALDWGNK